MSSAYPPFGGVPSRPSCQRCGAPLPSSDAQCRNCGYQNAPAQNSPQFHASSSADGWGNGRPQPLNNVQQQPIGNQQWEQMPGPAFHNQANSLRNPTFPVPQMNNQQPPFGQPVQNMGSGTYQNGPVQNMGSDFHAQSPQRSSAQAYGAFSGPQQSGSQSFSQSAFRSGVSSPVVTNPFPQQGNVRPSSDFPSPPQAPKGRRPRIGLIIGIVALILLVVVGGLFGTTLFSGGQGKATPSPTVSHVMPTPTGPALFSEDFANNKNGWVTQSMPGKFGVTVGGGALTLEDDNHSMLWEMVPGKGGGAKVYSDFKLFVDATQTKGDQNNGYGVFVRGVLDQNGNDFSAFYRFSLYGDGSYAIFKGTADANGQINNKTLVDFTTNPAVQPAGGLNHIVIEAKGSSMTFSVNGQTLNTVTDSSFASGLVALFVNNLQNSKTGAQAKFSHLSIYPPQAK